MRGTALVRVLGPWLLAVLPATLLVSGVSAADEPVWCHEVRAGDTLVRIARRYQVSRATLRRVDSVT